MTRDGEALVLAPDADVDARRFEEAAAAVRAAPEGERAGLARAALSRYAGDLLPTDRYEPWASAARERLRRRYLDLLDLLADDAVERGDLDEAIRLLDQAQIAEPLDESRYVRAAELLLFQGRRGSAAVLVERALRLRAGLGLAETPRLARLPSHRLDVGAARFGRTIGRAARERSCDDMLVTLIVRLLLPDPLAAGELVGEIENVHSGERTLVRELADLVGFARQAAEHQLASPSTSA